MHHPNRMNASVQHLTVCNKTLGNAAIHILVCSLTVIAFFSIFTSKLLRYQIRFWCLYGCRLPPWDES